MLMKMRGQMKKGRNQKGFTLVELMVVVVIIGILAAIAVPVYNKVSGTAEKNACFANQRTIEGAIEAYRAGEAKDPENIDDLVEKKYLKEVPKCPVADAEYSIGEIDESLRVVPPDDCTHGPYAGGTKTP